MLKKAEASAIAIDARVDQVINHYGDFATEIGLYNTRGLSLNYVSSMGYAYFAPILKAGDAVKNEMVLRLFKQIDKIRATEAVAEAILKTRQMFGAKSLPSGTYPGNFG